MGDINTIKNMLLFAVKNGCKEMHLSVGKLPLLLSNNGDVKHLNGILPVNEALLGDICTRYMSGDDNALVTIGNLDFLLAKMGSSLVFRQLPLVSPDEDISKELSSVCYSDNGLILVTSDSQELRTFHSYSIGACVTSNRNITMAVIERNKLFSLKDMNSKIINIYKPDMELDVLIRITDQISYECLMIPDCNTDQALQAAANLSHDALVILGTSPELAKGLDRSNVLHTMNISKEGRVSKKMDPELKINSEVIIKNLRGYRHA